MYFFTSDEHYGHGNIIKYCSRPFAEAGEMNDEIIRRHNEVVRPNDTVIHGGDFTLSNTKYAENIIRRLNGNHIFARGSHDSWMKDDDRYHEILEFVINKQMIVVCHYAMRVWPRSHYGSWCLYGHSHGKLEPVGKQWDIGVDNNNFYPISFDQLVDIMASRPDNPNLIRDKRH